MLERMIPGSRSRQIIILRSKGKFNTLYYNWGSFGLRGDLGIHRLNIKSKYQEALPPFLPRNNVSQQNLILKNFFKKLSNCHSFRVYSNFFMTPLPYFNEKDQRRCSRIHLCGRAALHLRPGPDLNVGQLFREAECWTRSSTSRLSDRKSVV